MSIFFLVCSVNIRADNKLEISTKILDFPNDKRNNHFTIRNYGDENAEIEISIKSIETKNHKVVYSSRKDLILYPQKFTLEPGHYRDIKVIKKVQNKDHDQIFLINILNNAFQHPQATDTTKDLVDNDLYFDTHNSLLVIIRPNKIVGKIEATKINDEIIINNIGNTTIRLEKIKQCDNLDCVHYHSLLLFPNSKKVIKLEMREKPIHLVKNIINNKKPISIT